MSGGLKCLHCAHPRGFHHEQGMCLAHACQCLVSYGPRCGKEFYHQGRAVLCRDDQGHDGEHMGTELNDFADSTDWYGPLGPQEPEGAGSTQVGGEHYRKMPIQPWDIIDAHGLGFYAGNALKYLLRAGRKGPALEDLKKCRHYLDKMIELEEGKG